MAFMLKVCLKRSAYSLEEIERNKSRLEECWTNLPLLRCYHKKFGITILFILWPGEMWLYKQKQSWKLRLQFTRRVQRHGGKFQSELGLLINIWDDYFFFLLIFLWFYSFPSCSGSHSQLLSSRTLASVWKEGLYCVCTILNRPFLSFRTRNEENEQHLRISSKYPGNF